MTYPKSRIYLTIGMMWKCDKPNKPLESIVDAATYYLQKYGVPPQVCHINPDMFKDSTFTQTGGEIILVQDRTIQPNHLWLGVIR